MRSGVSPTGRALAFIVALNCYCTETVADVSCVATVIYGATTYWIPPYPRWPGVIQQF